MGRGVPHISPGSSAGGEEKASASQTRIDPGLENCYLTQLPIVICLPGPSWHPPSQHELPRDPARMEQRMRRTFFAATVCILGACTTMSDAEFTRSHCEGQGLEVGTAQFERCVANKQEKMERERAIRRSFRYGGP